MTTPTLPKHKANFFAAVRARGVLNTMLDGPAKKFEENNPGWRARWEYAPSSGDKTFIVAREAMGFHIVDAKELGETTTSEQKEGPVRCGDLILMAAPADLVNELDLDDAHRAYEDFKLPESSYREYVKGIKVRTRGGEEAGPEPVGSIKVTSETVGVKEPQHDLDKGGGDSE